MLRSQEQFDSKSGVTLVFTLYDNGLLDITKKSGDGAFTWPGTNKVSDSLGRYNDMIQHQWHQESGPADNPVTTRDNVKMLYVHDIKVKSWEDWFCDLPNLEKAYIEGDCFTETEIMWRMMQDCPKLSYVNAEEWQVTSKCWNYHAAFRRDPLITKLDLSRWDTSGANSSGYATFANMFVGMTALEELNLSSMTLQKQLSGKNIIPSGSIDESSGVALFKNDSNLKKIVLPADFNPNGLAGFDLAEPPNDSVYAGEWVRTADAAGSATEFGDTFKKQYKGLGWYYSSVDITENFKTKANQGGTYEWLKKADFEGSLEITEPRGHFLGGGVTLTASVTGENGWTNDDVTWQWYRSDVPSGTETEINGATARTYETTPDDVGKCLTVKVSSKKAANDRKSVYYWKEGTIASQPQLIQYPGGYMSNNQDEYAWWWIDGSNVLRIETGAAADAKVDLPDQGYSPGADPAATAPWSIYGKAADNPAGIVATAVDMSPNLRPASMAYWFQGMEGVTSTNMGSWDMSQCTSVAYVFNDATSLATVDINSWDITKCKVLDGAFKNVGATSISVTNRDRFDDDIARSWRDSPFSGVNLVELDVSGINTSRFVKDSTTNNDSRTNDATGPRMTGFLAGAGTVRKLTIGPSTYDDSHFPPSNSVYKLPDVPNDGTYAGFWVKTATVEGSPTEVGTRKTSTELAATASKCAGTWEWAQCYTVKYFKNTTEDVTPDPWYDDQVTLVGVKATLRGSGTSDDLAPSRVGYAFRGWSENMNATPGAVGVYAGGAQFDLGIVPGEIFTLYAVWEANSYTVTFDAGDQGALNVGGSEQSTAAESVAYGDKPTIAGFTVEEKDPDHYFLAGWQYDALQPDGSTKQETTADPKTVPIDHDTTFTAVWGQRYSVSYHPGDHGSFDGSVSDKTLFKVDMLNSATPQPNLDAADRTTSDDATVPKGDPGWLFDCWLTDDGNEWSATVAGDVRYVAQWKAKTGPNATTSYTIVRDAKGGNLNGEPDRKNVAWDSDHLTTEANPTRDGYVFDGWFTDEAFTIAVTATTKWSDLAGKDDTTAERTIFAKWRKEQDLWTPEVEQRVEHYLQTADLSGYEGNPANVDTVSVVAGATVTLGDSDFKKYTGFKVNKGVSELTGTAAADGGLVLKVRYDRIRFTVRFEANGGTGTMDDQEFAYGTGAALTPNAFARPGYRFAGWKVAGVGAASSSAQLLVAQASDDGMFAQDVSDSSEAGQDSTLVVQSVGDLIADQADGSALASEEGVIVTLAAQWVADEEADSGNADGDGADAGEKGGESAGEARSDEGSGSNTDVGDSDAAEGRGDARPSQARDRAVSTTRGGLAALGDALPLAAPVAIALVALCVVICARRQMRGGHARHARK